MTTAYEVSHAGAESKRQPWTEKLAESLAQESGLGHLTEAHWKVIHTLRSHFIQYGALPPMRFACDISRLEPHCVDQLFHTPQEAWRIAGLPAPGEEAEGYSYPGDMVQH